MSCFRSILREIQFAKKAMKRLLVSATLKSSMYHGAEMICTNMEKQFCYTVWLAEICFVETL